MCVHVRLYILEWRTARSLVHISTYCIVLHLEMYRVAKIVNFFYFSILSKTFFREVYNPWLFQPDWHSLLTTHKRIWLPLGTHARAFSSDNWANNFDTFAPPCAPCVVCNRKLPRRQEMRYHFQQKETVTRGEKLQPFHAPSFLTHPPGAPCNITLVSKHFRKRSLFRNYGGYQAGINADPFHLCTLSHQENINVNVT